MDPTLHGPPGLSRLHGPPDPSPPLVQIDLRPRGPAGQPPAAPGQGQAAPPDADEQDRALARATVGVVLGGGLLLLAPLIPAEPGAPMLLVGLAILGLLAAHLRPAWHPEADP